MNGGWGVILPVTDGNKCYKENQNGDMQKVACDGQEANLDYVIRKVIPKEIVSELDR